MHFECPHTFLNFCSKETGEVKGDGEVVSGGFEDGEDLGVVFVAYFSSISGRGPQNT